jgi:hypothetical protein
MLNPAGEIVRGRQRFTSINLPLIVDGNQVGERTPNIDSDPHGVFGSFN